MKYQIKKKIIVDCTLDSSEAIMFTKGGKHTVNMDYKNLFFGDIDDYNIELEISFQMDRKDQSRFDFINNSAQEAIDRRNNENKLP